jgi:hypothetical protein
MRVKWEVISESIDSIRIKAVKAVLCENDLLELESAGLRFNFSESNQEPAAKAPFFDGSTKWDSVSIVMQKTDNFASWQP